ncbi:MAG: hypothetical protein ACOYON_13175 [Fimbriimonas sp.]
MNFRDEEAASRTIERLEQSTGLDLANLFERALSTSPDPDLSLSNLERWLARTTNSRMHLEQIMAFPELGSLLGLLFGASQPTSDALIQNPELASLILEPGELSRRPTFDAIVQEGKRLLASATSMSHSLDRLRYLRQRWTIPITLNDLSGAWSQVDVWSALSELAEAIVVLARDLIWSDIAKRRGLGDCPVSILAFGKLGGGELNYSSDIDLVYVLDDNADEVLEREATRFCEALGRALSDRMGRGFLYRVDLRLRAFGSQGPILKSLRATEAYYRLYAEPWERMALLKSRVLVGSPDMRARWEDLRKEIAFPARVGEHIVTDLLGIRQRIEEHAEPTDLKRGPGGIRDIEFLCQILQMVHGHRVPGLQTQNTCHALVAVAEAGLVQTGVRDELVQAYTFLRKLEHRCQLLDDRQTHEVPTGPMREVVAHLTGFRDASDLDQSLGTTRQTVLILFSATFGKLPLGTPAREQLMTAFGSHSALAAQWFDLLPESEAFYESLTTNEGSLRRVQKILNDAPLLVAEFKRSVALTELLLSGEIEEAFDAAERLDSLSVEVPLRAVAEGFARSRARLLSQWALLPPGAASNLASLTLGRHLGALYDALIRHCAHRIYAEFDILALGSFGNLELAIDSDCDVLFLVENASHQREAESRAQELLAILAQLRRYGATFEVDLRLRPEGSKGLLVRTYDALRAYDLDGMELWERFALGHARPVAAKAGAFEVVRHCAYGLPLTPDRLKELVRMKRRVESERVNPAHQKRQIKLGHGGLNDIEWMVHLHEMRYPTATLAESSFEIPDRIRTLGRLGLIHVLEVENLLEAHAHLHALRSWITLLGYQTDLLPENPDKLDRLAAAMGIADGNHLLARHGAMIEAVRLMYTDSLERLRV